MHPFIYADPGVGKTCLAASGPDSLLIHPPTDNIGSALRLGHTFDEEVVTDWGEMNDIYEFLRHEKHDYQWVWWDSVSLGQDSLLHSIMEDVVAEKPHRVIEIPDVREYMINMKRIQTWVREMIALPINFGITAHPYRFEVPDRESNDRDDTEIIYMPWVQGKMMPEKLCGYMNIVGYLEAREDKEGNERRILWTSRDRRFYAKDQFGAFNGKVIDPTVPKLEKLVSDAIGGQPKKRAPAKKPIAKKAPVKKRPVKKRSNK